MSEKRCRVVKRQRSSFGKPEVESDENKVEVALLRPVAPNVKPRYAQVARYQGPRQRRRDPNREDHLRDTQNPAHSVRK